MMKKIVCIHFCLICLMGIFLACGKQNSGTTQMLGKNLAVSVEGSKSFDTTSDFGKIDFYQITISADDLAKAIVQKFKADSNTANILNVPVGSDRAIEIVALNPFGQTIRRGKKDGIDILPGQATQINLVMKSVPIFTNIRNKSAVANERLRFGIFGEPDSPLEIIDTTSKKPIPLIDKTTASTKIDTSNADGLFSLIPKTMDAGVYIFAVRDTKTGEETTATVTLYSSLGRAGLGIYSGGMIAEADDTPVGQIAGQFAVQDISKSQAGTLGNTFWDFLNNIF